MAVVRIGRSAARQIARARDWWLENRDKAPSAFDDELDELIERLSDRPELIGRPLAQQRDVRRVYLRRVRYYVYFRVLEGGASVDIAAVWHASRRNGPLL